MARLTKILAAKSASQIILRPFSWLEFDKSATQPVKPKFYYILKLMYILAGAPLRF